MHVPLFSILIPSYNRPAYLSLAIRSVVANSCQDFEIVVSDDLSPAASDIRRRLTPDIDAGRLRYFAQEKNLGWSENRNFLLREARGEYVILLGDDDLLLPHSLETLAREIRANPNHDLYAFGFSVVDEHGEVCYSRYAPHALEINRANRPAQEELLLSRVVPFWVCHPFTICYKTSIRERLRYEQSAGIGDDILFLIEAVNAGYRMLVIPEVLFHWRRLQGPPVSGTQANLSGSVDKTVLARFRIYVAAVSRLELDPAVKRFLHGAYFKEVFLFDAVDMAGGLSQTCSDQLLREGDRVAPLVEEYRNRRPRRVGAIRARQLKAYQELFGWHSLWHLFRLRTGRR